MSDFFFYFGCVIAFVIIVYLYLIADSKAEE